MCKKTTWAEARVWCWGWGGLLGVTPPLRDIDFREADEWHPEEWGCQPTLGWYYSSTRGVKFGGYRVVIKFGMMLLPTNFTTNDRFTGHCTSFAGESGTFWNLWVVCPCPKAEGQPSHHRGASLYRQAKISKLSRGSFLFPKRFLKFLEHQALVMCPFQCVREKKDR